MMLENKVNDTRNLIMQFGYVYVYGDSPRQIKSSRNFKKQSFPISGIRAQGFEVWLGGSLRSGRCSQNCEVVHQARGTKQICQSLQVLWDLTWRNLMEGSTLAWGKFMSKMCWYNLGYTRLWTEIRVWYIQRYWWVQQRFWQV